MFPSPQIALAQNTLTQLAGQPLSVSKTHMVIAIHMCGLMSSFFMLRDVLFEQKPEKIEDTTTAHRANEVEKRPFILARGSKKCVCATL